MSTNPRTFFPSQYFSKPRIPDAPSPATGPFRQSCASDAAGQEKSLSEIVAELSKIQATTKTLAKAANATSTSPRTAEEIRHATSTISASSARIDAVLRAMLPAKHFNYVHNPASSMTAYRLFDVVEITEMICEFLAHSDVLAMQQVNKSIFAIIEGSSKIQARITKLVWRTAADPPYAFEMWPDMDELRNTLPLPSIRLEYIEDDWPNPNCYGTITVRCYHGLWKSSAMLGARLRKIQLFDRTLTEVRARIMWCGASSKVKNEGGLTLGDIYDACAAIRKGHRLCVNAPDQLYDPDGIVLADVHFTNNLPEDVMRAFSALLAKHRDEYRAQEQAARDAAAQPDKTAQLNSAYCQAKVNARNAGEPIPTFVEYEASLTAAPQAEAGAEGEMVDMEALS